MLLASDLPIDPQAIILIVVAILAALKSIFDKNKEGEQSDQPHLEDENYDPYAEYEAELARQRAEVELASPPPTPGPPPLPAKAVQVSPPKLTAAEQAALKNFKASLQNRKRKSSFTRGRVNKLLASPSAARDALVLAEILGPPKALKKDD